MKDEEQYDVPTRALLDAARRERPSPSLHDRVHAAARSAATRRAPGVARRPIFVTLALAAAVALALVVPHRREPMISLSAEPPQERPAPVTAPSSDPAVAETPREAPVERRLPSRTQPSAKNTVVAPPEAPPAPPPSMSAEIALLDRARGSLASDPRQTLSVLDEYDHALHGTHLAAEATLLRIEALAGAGRREAAGELARRFVEGNPGSALAERARAFMTVPAGAATPGVDAGGNKR